MPGLGATGGGKWQLSVGWRQSNADRSYFKSHVNHNFTHNWGPQLRLSILDATAAYKVNDRVSVLTTMPIVMNKYSELFPPNGTGPGSADQRFGWSPTGIGDISVYSQSWLLKPIDHPFSNVALGVGIKIPSGDWNVQRNLPNLDGTNFLNRAVYPPSTMPGDGGTGIIFGGTAFKTFRKPVRLRGQTVFASASYLCNPRDTNGTASIVSSLGVPLAPQYFNRLTNSVTDSYNVQIGASLKIPGTWDKPKLRGLRSRLVYGWQGIPTHDLIGGSSGYRQPGYTMTFAPGLTYSYKNNLVIADVPIAFAKYISPGDSAIPDLPVQTAHGVVPAPFSPTRNLGLIAPVGISLRYVRSF